ncbi:palmitoyltransferase [Blastocystis sp. ATCC 50177/Nand II]|uniref:Palmitoyltransferase n=1 Tax=Blastocystis sp. subtype 1 (strain ATCC 50177 / NandII) TaxID=478820 RepID=A0A196SLL3_BLAHN|nr:palmitoyltransferase [Blastocystis sp. ATCC 50177/Nand II]
MFVCGKCWCVCNSPWSLLVSLFGYCQIAFVLYCTLDIVVYPMYGFSSMGIVLTMIICFFAIMVIWSGLKASFTEPGIVVDQQKLSPEMSEFMVGEESYNYCSKCNQMKPFRAHHCSKCNVCILKMDHHCQWINNCVGARNQKYFILYLLYVHMGEVFACILGFSRIYMLRSYFPRYTTFEYTKDLYPFNRVLPNWLLTRLRLPLFDDELVPLLFLCIEVLLSLLFAIFTVFLFIDQINAIRYDMTYVEYLKEYNVKTLENDFYDCLISCMGEPPCWRWFFPIQGVYLDAVIKKLSHEYLEFNEEEEETEEEKKNK